MDENCCEKCGQELPQGRLLEFEEVKKIADYIAKVEMQTFGGGEKEREAILACVKSRIDDGLGFATETQAFEYCMDVWSVISRCKEIGLIQTDLNFPRRADV